MIERHISLKLRLFVLARFDASENGFVGIRDRLRGGFGVASLQSFVTLLACVLREVGHRLVL